MRLAIEIDDQLLAVLTAAAEQRLSSLEATAVSILKAALRPVELEIRNGVPLLPRALPGRPVAPQTIRAIEDELLQEDHRRLDGLPGLSEPGRHTSR